MLLMFRKAVGYAKFKDHLAQPKDVVFIMYILSSFSKKIPLCLCRYVMKEREKRLHIFLIRVSFITSCDGEKDMFLEEKKTLISAIKALNIISGLESFAAGVPCQASHFYQLAACNSDWAFSNI